MATTSATPEYIKLTTLFIPPSGCLAPTYTIGDRGDDSLITTAPTTTVVRGFTGSCFPSGASAVFSYTGGEDQVGAYFTPALCPYSWYTASTISTAGLNYGLAYCCPESFSVASYVRDNGFQFDCTATGNPTVVDGGQTTVYTSALQVARGISFNYRSADQAVLASANAAAASLSSAEAASESGVASSATGAASIPTSSDSSVPVETTAPTGGPATGLSTGAQVGIGVGVGVAGLLAVLALGFFFLRRHRNRKVVTSKPGPFETTHEESKGQGSDDVYEVDHRQGANAVAYDKAELPGPEGREFMKAELSGQATKMVQRDVAMPSHHEVDGSAKLKDMDDNHLRAELDGTWRGAEMPSP